MRQIARLECVGATVTTWIHRARGVSLEGMLKGYVEGNETGRTLRRIFLSRSDHKGHRETNVE